MPVYAIADMLKGCRQGALGMLLPHLTDKQAQCLAFIGQRYLDAWTYPTRREIAHHMGLNSCSADFYVGPLSRKGFLTIDKTVDQKNGRNIRLTRAAFLKLAQMGVDITAIPIDGNAVRDLYASVADKVIGA